MSLYQLDNSKETLFRPNGGVIPWAYPEEKTSDLDSMTVPPNPLLSEGLRQSSQQSNDLNGPIGVNDVSHPPEVDLEVSGGEIFLKK